MYFHIKLYSYHLEVHSIKECNYTTGWTYDIICPIETQTLTKVAIYLLMQLWDHLQMNHLGDLFGGGPIFYTIVVGSHNR